MIEEIKLFSDFIKYSSAITKKFGKMSLDKEFMDDISKYQASILEMQSIVIDLNQFIFDLQSEIHNLKEDIKTLNEKHTNTESWLIEKENFTLISLAPQINVYVDNSRAKNPKEAIWYCPQCFNDKKKSVINKKNEDYNRKFFECNTCGFSFTLEKSKKAKVTRISGRSIW
jgi:formate dehydrogenase maturation protein FdhE